MRNERRFRAGADGRQPRLDTVPAVFLVDDNITLNVRRFEALLCQAFVAARLDGLEYVVQAMTSAMATHGPSLAPLMHRAGFRYVFLGIENSLEHDLAFLRARAKTAGRPPHRAAVNASIEAIAHLHRHKMYVVGGMIVGNPDDTRESIEANLEFARRYGTVDEAPTLADRPVPQPALRAPARHSDAGAYLSR
jgi:anaerobic magnesium-protoporphyrin IX monomethyl ester cyclase